MIVLPLCRSVGLRAVTASSRVGTVPMFVRNPSVAHPLDDLTQLGAIGLDHIELLAIEAGERS
jgi:hypothetical protein